MISNYYQMFTKDAILKMIFRVFALGLLLVSASLHSEPIKLGPSFSCDKATTAIERKICNDSQLAEADLFLADIYRQGLSQNPATKTALIAEQKRWLTEVRDDLCLANDFSWSKQSTESFWTEDLLLKCYQVRIAELRSKVIMDDEFVNKWKKLFYGAQGDILVYGGIDNPITNIPRPAQNFYNDKVLNNKVRYFGHECEGDSYILSYADEKFIRFAKKAPNCEDDFPPDTFSNLCWNGSVFAPVTGYWACHQKPTTLAALSEMQVRISQGLLNKMLAAYSETTTDAASFVWGLTRMPALVYNDPRFYTPEAISWAIEHKAIFSPVLTKHKNILRIVAKQILLEREWIMQQPDWQKKLASMTGSPLGNSEIIPPSDDMIRWNSGLENTLYDLHDFYVQIWARLYQNGGMDKAVEAIRVFSAELEAKP